MSEWYPPSRPRRVEGGIKARSKRGKIGEQWWSRRFIAVLESFGMSGRLARGRNYARAGQIVDFALTTGTVTARVQGSRPNPYLVRIKVLPLTTAQWRQVEAALAAQALFRARLLAGEMPDEIEEVFAACGTPLFPHSARDLDMSCSCPDWGVPCKHLAATCYVLAEAFDGDPFLMLAWRGRDRADLLAALRRITADEAAAAQRAVADASGTSGTSGTSLASAPRGSAALAAAATSPAAQDRVVAPAVADVTGPPLPDCLDNFWSAGMSQAALRARTVTPAAAPDVLLRTFEPPPVEVRGKDLVTLLRPAYLRMTGDQGRSEQPDP
jgi:uncharacterized Zn finger protein